MGSGKSTFLNYIYSILNNTDATITANQIVDQANETNTRHLEGFRVNKNGILNVWDLWGIEAQPEEIKNEEEIQLDEHNITNILDKLLSGKYLKNGILDRDHPIKIEEEEIYDINKRVHSLILVIDLNYRMNMENISQIKTIFKICRSNQIIINLLYLYLF